MRVSDWTAGLHGKIGRWYVVPASLGLLYWKLSREDWAPIRERYRASVGYRNRDDACRVMCRPSNYRYLVKTWGPLVNLYTAYSSLDGGEHGTTEQH